MTYGDFEMAAWIEASPEQRFHQYIVPAARKAVADGGWMEAMLAEYDAQAEKHEAIIAAGDADDIEVRRAVRRLASVVRDRDSLRRDRERDLATIAKADCRNGKAA